MWLVILVKPVTSMDTHDKYHPDRYPYRCRYREGAVILKEAIERNGGEARIVRYESRP